MDFYWFMRVKLFYLKRKKFQWAPAALLVWGYSYVTKGLYTVNLSLRVKLSTTSNTVCSKASEGGLLAQNDLKSKNKFLAHVIRLPVTSSFLVPPKWVVAVVKSFRSMIKSEVCPYQWSQKHVWLRCWRRSSDVTRDTYS